MNIAIKAASNTISVSERAKMMMRRAVLDHRDVYKIQHFDELKHKYDKLKSINRSNKNLSKLLHREMGQDSAAVEALHPIFGQLVFENAHKKVYSTPVEHLINKSHFEIWEKQRTFSLDRAKAIAGFKKATKTKTGFPGFITCVEKDHVDHTSNNAKEQTVTVIDGQHRIGGMEILVKDNFWKPNEPVMVEIYKKEVVQNEFDIIHLFNEVNSAQPVLNIDLPSPENVSESVATAKLSEKTIITEAVTKLKQTYPSMFSPSIRCRVPNVNIDNLRSDIFESNILSLHKIQTSDDLYDYLLDQNAKIGKMKKIQQLKNKKATKHQFFLGMTKRWIE